MKSVTPDRNELSRIFKQIPVDQPIVMINLLKFRPKADYPDHVSQLTGREAYAEYSKTSLHKVKEIGGRLIWRGKVYGSLIAPAGEEWDEALLVRYPSIRAFKKCLPIPNTMPALYIARQPWMTPG
jgi:uncharacterized protein (DUF1330 family)